MENIDLKALELLESLGERKPFAIQGESNYLVLVDKKKFEAVIVRMSTPLVQVVNFQSLLRGGYWEEYEGDLTAAELADKVRAETV